MANGRESETPTPTLEQAATPPAATGSENAADNAPAARQAETPSPPQPPEPPKPTARPWWRNIVNTTLRRRRVPSEEDGPLEREQNYSRSEEINQLVESIRNGSWEASDRARIFEERYGRQTILTQMKAWLSGEQDVTYNENTGTVEFNYGTEVLRRMANLGVNVAETGGLMAAFGLLTGGGAAIALGPALLGSSIGRALVEARQGFSGEERTRREKLIIARERYYKKALEIASRVEREEPEQWEDPRTGQVLSWDQISPEQRANYTAERNEAVKNLINFVYSSEQNSVVFRQTAEGAYFNEVSEDRISGRSLEAGGRTRGEPSEGIAAGPALNEGMEVYQPGEEAPDATRLAGMEREFAQFRKRYDKMKAVFSAVGGLTGGVFQVLAAQKAQFVQLYKTLSEGGVVRLDIDGNFVWHAVQRAGDGASQIWDGASNLVYHLNSQLEALRAAVKGATIIPGLSEFGSHALKATMGQIVEAVNKQAWLEAGRVGAAIVGGLGAHALWKRGNIESDAKRFEKNREKFEQDSEMLRRRGIPEKREIPIEEIARENGKPMPEVGQTWRRQVGVTENGRPIYEYREITSVDKRDNRVVVGVNIDNPYEVDTLVDRMSAEQLVEDLPDYDNYQCVIRREGGEDEKGEPSGGGGESPGPQPPGQGSREPTLPEGGKGVGADEGEGKTEPGKPGKSEEEKSPEEKELDELKKNNPHEVFLRKQIDNNEFEAEVLGVNRKLVFENLSEKIKPAEGENWQTEVLNGREKDNVILEVRGIRKVEKGDWVPKTKEINWKEKGESGWEIGGSDQKTEDEKEKSAVVAVARDPFGKDAVWLPKSRKEKIFAEDWRKPGSRRHYFELDPKSEFIVFNPRKIETGDVMVTIEETGGKKRILNTGIDALVNVFDLKAIKECANVDIRRRAEETLGATIRRIKEAQLASPGKEEEHQSLEEAMADRIKATDRGREWPEGPTTEGERETPPAPEPSQEPPVGEEPLPPPPAEPIASSVPPPIKQPIGADTAEEPELEEKPPKNIGAVVEEPGSEQPEATVAGPTSYEVEIGGKKVEIGPGNTLEIKIPGQPEVTDVVKEYIPDPEGDTSKVAFGLETGQAARFDKDQLRQLLERGNITVS
ncbi:hypothetical protein CO019_01170 [Candidatus Berkelbacteria bacterium CG_4_9_14_0_2_um_filter_42_30]|uniref:Uncharacterized protein n=4 Tax=Candidatus Berkelbacteria TaxID=1618330 RepID=A0A2M8G2A4_9BACT|nr:MAG: hypothetical protein CO019_01170 [Candidatus Berkelbacteria bacterium CG_4_9_14_0_2_um_filter_42_30]